MGSIRGIVVVDLGKSRAEGSSWSACYVLLGPVGTHGGETKWT